MFVRQISDFDPVSQIPFIISPMMLPLNLYLLQQTYSNDRKDLPCNFVVFFFFFSCLCASRPGRNQKEQTAVIRFLTISVMDLLGLISLLVLGIVLSSSWSTSHRSAVVSGSSLSDDAAGRQVNSAATPLLPFSHTPAAQSFHAQSSLSRQHQDEDDEDESRILKRVSALSAKRWDPALALGPEPGQQEDRPPHSRRAAGESLVSNVDESTNRAYPHQGHRQHHLQHDLRENQHPIRRLTGKSAFLRREMLRNTSVTCNDGTTAGYYIRSNPSSKRWLVFLEGGWHCFSPLSCHQRWTRARPLMTSAHWPQMRNSK